MLLNTWNFYTFLYGFWYCFEFLKLKWLYGIKIQVSFRTSNGAQSVHRVTTYRGCFVYFLNILNYVCLGCLGCLGSFSRHGGTPPGPQAAKGPPDPGLCGYAMRGTGRGSGQGRAQPDSNLDWSWVLAGWRKVWAVGMERKRTNSQTFYTPF